MEVILSNIKITIKCIYSRGIIRKRSYLYLNEEVFTFHKSQIKCHHLQETFDFPLQKNPVCSLLVLFWVVFHFKIVFPLLPFPLLPSLLLSSFLLSLSLAILFHFLPFHPFVHESIHPSIIFFQAMAYAWLHECLLALHTVLSTFSHWPSSFQVASICPIS